MAHFVGLDVSVSITAPGRVAKVTGPISFTLIADHVLIIGPATRQFGAAA